MSAKAEPANASRRASEASPPWKSQGRRKKRETSERHARPQNQPKGQESAHAVSDDDRRLSRDASRLARERLQNALDIARAIEPAFALSGASPIDDQHAPAASREPVRKAAAPRQVADIVAIDERGHDQSRPFAFAVGDQPGGPAPGNDGPGLVTASPGVAAIAVDCGLEREEAPKRGLPDGLGSGGQPGRFVSQVAVPEERASRPRRCRCRRAAPNRCRCRHVQRQRPRTGPPARQAHPAAAGTAGPRSRATRRGHSSPRDRESRPPVCSLTLDSWKQDFTLE